MKQRTTSVRSKVARSLMARFMMRFHGVMILLWCFFAGLLTTKALLAVGVQSMPIRYPIAVIMSYLAFLLGVRLWLEYIGYGRYLRRADAKKDGGWDVPDIPVSSKSTRPSADGSSGGECRVPLEPQGGQFGGGGASSHFSPADASGMSPLPDAGLADTGATTAEGVGFADGLAGAADGGLPVVVLALILVILAAIFGVGVYVVNETPVILIDAAFEVLLAGGLVKVVRQGNSGGWVGGIVRASWRPFAAALTVSELFALAARYGYPQAHSLGELLAVLLR